ANGQLGASYLIAKGNVDAARASLAAADAQLAATTVRARAATVAMTSLSRAMAFFGGPIGLGLTAILGVMAFMATRTSDVDAATQQLVSTVQDLERAYEGPQERVDGILKSTREAA